MSTLRKYLSITTERRGRRAIAVAGPLMVALLGAACSGGSGAVAGGELAGTVEISGSSTVEPISTWVAEVFEDIEPGVQVNVDGPGTGDGFALFCDGQIDISDASRPIKDEESANCAANGVEFIELKVAIDGLAVITNAQHANVTCLGTDDLYALVGPESTGFRNWSDAQALASELGSQTRFPDGTLDITAPGEESGTFDSFVDMALSRIGTGRAKLGKISQDDTKSTRPDYVSQSNDNAIIQGVGGSATGLGWVGYAFADQATGVKMLEIRNSEGECTAPGPDTIASGAYPLSRDLYIYVNAERADDPALAAYVDFYMDNLTDAAREADYIPLPDNEVVRTRNVWTARTTGSSDG
jgi:phosphate transport system substrate-binding protein